MKQSIHVHDIVKLSTTRILNPEIPPPFWNDWHHFTCIFLGRRSAFFQHHVLRRVHGPPPPCHLNQLLPELLTFIGWDWNAQHFLNFIQSIDPINQSKIWLLLCYSIFYKCVLTLRAYLHSVTKVSSSNPFLSLSPSASLTPSLLPHSLSLFPPVNARALENAPQLGITVNKLWPLDCNLIRTASYQSRIEHGYHEMGILYNTAAWGTVSRVGITFTLTQQGSKRLILVFWSILIPPGVSTHHVRSQTSEHSPGQFCLYVSIGSRLYLLKTHTENWDFLNQKWLQAPSQRLLTWQRYWAFSISPNLIRIIRKKR